MTIYEKVRLGIKLDDIFIIDSHCHMDTLPGSYMPRCSPKAIVDEMDNLGINIACVAHNASLGPDFRWGNDRIMEVASEYPGRFFGYCTINPHYPEDIEEELERCFKNKAMKGIKIHPQFHQRTMECKNYKVVYEYAEIHRLPVLVHTYSWEEITNMDRYAAEYPNAIFIMAHTGGEIIDVERALDVINRRPNIYTDLAVSEAREGNVEWLVKEIGSLKILFGSDMPFFEARPTIARIAAAEISEDEKLNILGLNMKRILNI